MDAVVTGEDDVAVGLSVLDDRGVEHVLDVRKADGAIPGHESEGYPDDPADRTGGDDERVQRVRRFARFYLYRERGYPTLRPRKNPDHVAAAAVALADEPLDRVETLLEDCYRRVRGHSRDGPGAGSTAGATGSPIYRQELYLGVDDRAVGRVAAGLSAAAGEGGDGGREPLGEFTKSPDPARSDGPDEDAPDDAAAGALRIEATSALERLHAGRSGGARNLGRGGGNPRTDPAGTHAERSPVGSGRDPPVQDRDPDARVEVPPFEPESLDGFRWQLVRHLFCQVRDCYLCAGVAPPEPFRILGPGRVDAAIRYERYDCYDRYHDPDAAVGTWFEDWTPGDADGRVE